MAEEQTVSVPSPAPIPVPSVGRIVHVVSRGAACHAALVTSVWKQESGAQLINVVAWDPSGGQHTYTLIQHASEHPDPWYAEATWHWPERVDATFVPVKRDR